MSNFIKLKKISKNFVTENKVRALKNINIVKPTLKRYLNSKVRSRFRRIDSEDFLTALMLPVQRFRKSNVNKIWSDSRKMI